MNNSTCIEKHRTEILISWNFWYFSWHLIFFLTFCFCCHTLYWKEVEGKEYEWVNGRKGKNQNKRKVKNAVKEKRMGKKSERNNIVYFKSSLQSFFLSRPYDVLYPQIVPWKRYRKQYSPILYVEENQSRWRKQHFKVSWAVTANLYIEWYQKKNTFTVFFWWHLNRLCWHIGKAKIIGVVWW